MNEFGSYLDEGKRLEEQRAKNKEYQFVLKKITPSNDDLHYNDSLKFIETTLPIRLASRITDAFDKLYAKEKTLKAPRQKIIDMIVGDDMHSSVAKREKETEILLDYFERCKYIEKDGDYIQLGGEFRKAFGIPLEDKTTYEKYQEKIAEIETKSIETVLDEGIIVKNDKNRIEEKTERDQITIKRYQAIIAGMLYLIGLNYLATSKYINKFVESAYDGIRTGIENSDLAEYFLNKGVKSAENVVKSAKEIPSLVGGYVKEIIQENIEKKK